MCVRHRNDAVKSRYRFAPALLQTNTVHLLELLIRCVLSGTQLPKLSGRDAAHYYLIFTLVLSEVDIVRGVDISVVVAVAVKDALIVRRGFLAIQIGQGIYGSILRPPVASI